MCLSFRIGRGWLDSNPPPPSEVQQVLQIHAPDRHGVLCVHSHSLLHGQRASSDVPLWGRNPETNSATDVDVDVAARVFGVVDHYMAHLAEDDTDVASLIFVNFRPLSFSLSARPLGMITDIPDLQHGLQWFLRSVVASIQGDNMWSVCDWAMLTAVRSPIS